MKNSKQKFGPWTIVTGANSGIGAAFVNELAARGYNIVLVGRRIDAVQKKGNELMRKYNIQTRNVIVDLSDHDFLASIAKATDDLDIGLLVSNAGDAAMGALLKIELSKLKSMLKLNTQSHLELTHYFGRRFAKRGQGGIILISSTAALQGTPYIGNYAGAKAYLLNMGTALNYEMRGTGVNVTVLLPGPTKTPGLTDKPAIPLSKLPAPVMKPAAVAKIGLKALNKNRPFVIAGRMNRMMSNFGVLIGKVKNRNMWGALITGIVPAELKAK